MNETLKDMLIRHEGLKLQVYKDSLGIQTIGVGHNLNNGISKAAALFILDEDIQTATNDLLAALPWVGDIDWPRKAVLIDMTFNMGIDRLIGFVNTLNAIQDKNWQKAHDEMLDSIWAREVGSRATELATIILTGQLLN
jgi:lysozyme